MSFRTCFFLFFREAGSLRVGVVMLYLSAVWGGGGGEGAVLASCSALHLLSLPPRAGLLRTVT